MLNQKLHMKTLDIEHLHLLNAIFNAFVVIVNWIIRSIMLMLMLY